MRYFLYTQPNGWAVRVVSGLEISKTDLLFKCKKIEDVDDIVEGLSSCIGEPRLERAIESAYAFNQRTQSHLATYIHWYSNGGSVTFGNARCVKEPDYTLIEVLAPGEPVGILSEDFNNVNIFLEDL